MDMIFIAAIIIGIVLLIKVAKGVVKIAAVVAICIAVYCLASKWMPMFGTGVEANIEGFFNIFNK